MPRPRRPQAMCYIRPEIVRVVAGRTGGRDGIMQTLGISWNSWTKIAAGNPVRRSVAERFRDRVRQTVPIDPDTCLIDFAGGGDGARTDA